MDTEPTTVCGFYSGSWTSAALAFSAPSIEQANKVGANEISGPEFLVFNDAKPLVEARVNAIEDARTKAETYAKALNVRLGRVIAVTERERGHRPMPMMARSASQADVAPPIETGTNEIVARVTVVWELRQDKAGRASCTDAVECANRQPKSAS